MTFMDSNHWPEFSEEWNKFIFNVKYTMTLLSKLESKVLGPLNSVVKGNNTKDKYVNNRISSSI